MEPIKLGGAEIYLPNVKNANKLVKVLPKEGDNYVIQYNGIKIKFPEQTTVKSGLHSMPAKIYTYEGRTEIALNGAEITGSEKDDNIVSYCTNSIFKFEGGGKDRIVHNTHDMEADTSLPESDGNKLNIDESDFYVKKSTFYFDNTPWGEIISYFKKENSEMVNYDEDYVDIDSEWNIRMGRTKNEVLLLDEIFDDMYNDEEFDPANQFDYGDEE